MYFTSLKSSSVRSNSCLYWQVKANPKLLKHCAVVTLTLACCILATYMTAKQVIRFLENDDSTAIQFRQFNLALKDNYPTFSICLTGSDLYWNKAKPIFRAFGLHPHKFGEMLKGEDVFSHEYIYVSTPVPLYKYLMTKSMSRYYKGMPGV